MDIFFVRFMWYGVIKWMNVYSAKTLCLVKDDLATGFVRQNE